MELKVVLLEPAANVHDRLNGNLRRIFALCGYSARIINTATPEEVEKLIVADECQVLVSDLSLNVGTSAGLAFIGLTKRTYPEVFVVACSMGDASIRTMQANSPNFDVFFPKEQVQEPTEAEIETLAARFGRAFQRLTGFSVKRVGDKRKELIASNQRLSERELKALMSQVLGGLAGSREEFLPGEVTFEVLTGGFSGSLVMALNMESRRTELKFAPCVVKISDVEWARSECANFRHFAQWMLPYNQRTELFGYGETARFGAVGYSFVFGNRVEFKNLTASLIARDEETTRSILDSVFDKTDLNFYKKSIHESDVSMSLRYRNRHFRESKYDRTQSIFLDKVKELFGAREIENQIEIRGRKYPDPFRVLFGKEFGKYTVALCHGDLNSNNVFRASDGQIAFIDFQDTGPGHVFEDFVSVESSIRLFWGVETDRDRRKWPYSLLDLERDLLNERKLKAITEDYRGTIVPLRALAQNVAPDVFLREYLFAVAAVHLKLMRLPGLEEQQVARLIACVLETVARLDGGKVARDS